LADPPTRTTKPRLAEATKPGKTGRNSERVKAVVTRH
jgi:hypothetical protein